MSPRAEVWSPNHWTAKEFPGAAVLSRVDKVGLAEKLTESGLEGFEGSSSALLGGNSMSRGGTSKCKDPRKNRCVDQKRAKEEKNSKKCVQRWKRGWYSGCTGPCRSWGDVVSSL